MITPTNTHSNIGFSFSPGGLLLPYHMGVADCLIRQGYLNPQESMLAGSSAGSIATMAIGCGLDPLKALEGTIAISDRCLEMGKAPRGNLLPLLQEQMESLIGPEEFDFLQQRKATFQNCDKAGTGVVLAYREIFPDNRSHFQTTFETRQDLFRSVGYSCMFPFFTTNFPCIIDFGTAKKDENILRIPRLLMDGYFSVPREQFGCPVLENEFPNAGVDRTVAITCIPHEYFGMETIFDKTNNNNLISINDDDSEPPLSTTDIFRIATQSTSRQELTGLFEKGYRDAEAWCVREARNKAKNT